MSGLILPSSSLRFCHCCRTRVGGETRTRIRGGLVQGQQRETIAVNAVLCLQCRTKQHDAGWCMLCGLAAGPVWKCGFRAHVADRHPQLLEKLVNDPFEDIDPGPQTEMLGTVKFG
jgi:hypothetical protein